MKLNELSGSEALFGFCGWLTTRDQKTVMSAKDNAGDIVQKIGKFMKANKMENPKDGWEKALKHPKESLLSDLLNILESQNLLESINFSDIRK